MSTKMKRLSMLLMILLILAAGVIFLLPAEEENIGESQTIEGKEVTFWGEEESISEIKICNASGEAVFVREQGAFQMTGMEQYEKSQSKAETLVRSIAELNGIIVQESQIEKGRYGLEEPSATAEITGEESTTLYLGDYNESADCWYLMREGDETLYTIPAEAGSLLQASPYTYLDTVFIEPYEEGQVITERLRHITIERPDLDEPLEIAAIDETPQAYTSSYELISPVHVKTSLKAMNEKIGGLFGFAASRAIGPYAESEAQKYGMQEPEMVMTVEHDGKTDMFTVGAQSEEGMRYLIWSGSDLLYEIAESSLTFLQEDADSLFFAMALLPEIDLVAEVELEMEEQNYRFIIERDAQGEISGVTESGKQLDEKLFRTFYSFLLEVDVQEIRTEPAEGEARLSIVYRYLDGTEDKLEMIPLDDARNAGIVINGEPSFSGRLAYIEKLKTELEHLQNGEKIDTNW